MVRDPRKLDQNPVVIDPADVDAVLEDRPTKVSNPLAPPLGEVDGERSKNKPAEDSAFAAKTLQTVDGSPEGTPHKADDKRR